MKVLKEVTLYKNHGADKVGTWTIRAVTDSDELPLENSLAEATAKLVILHTKVIGGAAVEKEAPVAGKNIGRANETTPDVQACLELESRVNKQLDKGYVRTIEEAAKPATNALGLLQPMLAHPIGDVHPGKIHWDNAWAQPKLDGHRCLVNGIMYSRNGKEILLPHIRDFLGDYGLLGEKLDGELYLHGTVLQDIGSLVKKPREDSKALRYYVYDTIANIPYADRHASLADTLCEALKDPASPIVLLPALRVNSRDELNAQHLQWLAEGYEGSMLRHGQEGYRAGKRSASLLKVKDFTDIEATVVGFERGTPNGVLEVPVWNLRLANGVEFKATAHGDMHEKHAQWLDRFNRVGKQLTVQIFGYSKSGVPLLPVALRWREDI